MRQGTDGHIQIGRDGQVYLAHSCLIDAVVGINKDRPEAIISIVGYFWRVLRTKSLSFIRYCL